MDSKELEILFLFLGFGSGVRKAPISSVDVASVLTLEKKEKKQLKYSSCCYFGRFF